MGEAIVEGTTIGSPNPYDSCHYVIALGQRQLVGLVAGTGQAVWRFRINTLPDPRLPFPSQEPDGLYVEIQFDFVEMTATRHVPDY